MNTDSIVISARNVGKFYPIYARPQDRLKQALFRGRRRFFREFWALRKVTFEVQKGESIGIIGRNGSGKSTLLQIIAGTQAPTEGEAWVRGRMAALLQLGSGFNPEFTGRENVFLNAAILGLERGEIDERFEAIEAFADIGDYIDQPVKTYSSGMYARLAFAVAVSVDPDILIVDEILAVGDIGFQQKCVGRLRQMRENGLTLLFVSHSPDSIRSLCQKALFLSEGQTVFYGAAEQAVNLYLNHIRQQANQEAMQTQIDLGKPVPVKTDLPGRMRYGTGHAQIESVRLLDEEGAETRAFRFGDRITIEAQVRAHIDLEHLSMSFLIRDMTGIDLMGTTTFDEEVKFPKMENDHTVTVRFHFENILRAGNYGVCMAVNRVSQPDASDNVLFDQIDSCAAFAVIGDPDRRVHYKFHNPVEIDYDVSNHSD